MKIEELAVVLTVKAFRAWLLTKDDSFRMKANHAVWCPVARYLQEFYPDAQAYPTGVYIAADDREYDIPEWVEEYIRFFDHSCYGVQTVGPSVALEILDICVSGDFTRAIQSLS